MIMAMDDASVPPKYASPPPNYTYRAEWDPERSEYIARCLEFPGRSATAFTAHDAVAAMEKVVDDELDELASFSMQPPASLTDHRYSGTFLVRTSRTALAAHCRGCRATCLAEPLGRFEAGRPPADRQYR
jgi:hypothetical protein